MSSKYASLATRIIELLGGAGNITTAYHCQTRLRFGLSDPSKVDEEGLQQTDGVVTTLSSGGVYQVVIGTHVKDVFDEIDRELGGKAAGPAVGTPGAEERGLVATLIDFVSGAFQPIIPALSGAGMVKALMALLVVFGAITKESQTYAVLNFFADAVFYFLPVLLAFSIATKLRSNPLLAAAVAGLMLHPNWVAMVQAKAPVHLFDVIPLTLTNYSYSVLPIILVVLVQARVERFLNRIIPESVKLVFVPMLTILVMGTLAMSLLGPIGAVLSGYLAKGFAFLSTNAAWAPAVIIGGLLPVMVMFGIHNAIAPLGIVQMAQTGFDSIFGPGAVVSNICVGVASLVVAFRSKDVKLRQISTAGGITGLMGITEPALYGVLLPKRYPLVAAMIGGAAGGLYAGLTHTHRFATGTSGLPAVLLYIGDNTLRYLVNILIAITIGAVVTAMVTWVLAGHYEKADSAVPADGEVLADASTQTTMAVAPAAGSTLDLRSPVDGELIALADVPDRAFAAGAMGPGVGIEPSSGTILSPASGVVLVAMKSGHAYGLRTDDGAEVLVHVGVDTVTMGGDGFTPAVAKGDRVEAGQPLVEVDLTAIAHAGHPATVIMVVTNHTKLGEVVPAVPGPVTAGQPAITINA
ncbi:MULTISPECIES: beta-glucoside-specific PTS transporter subunit IIABC [unclassified Luteococcus]|uniref:beta-glucoside-specific PTS transporter subunit IIABC n=1 Tax=unclassified Luteococcus TaxID=2639923 RepID=UPI00313ED4AA